MGAVSGKRNKIADNYLSLKAYAISAKDRVIDYRGKKKGSLSSVGDLLATLGALDSVKIRAAPGLGMGGGKAPPLFAGKKVKEAKSLSKINGLVNESTRSRQVPARQARGVHDVSWRARGGQNRGQAW